MFSVNAKGREERSCGLVSLVLVVLSGLVTISCSPASTQYEPLRKDRSYLAMKRGGLAYFKNGSTVSPRSAISQQSSKRKSRNGSTAALCVTLCLSACSVSTQDSRTNTLPRELIWKIDRDLQLEQDGRVVSEDPQDELTTLAGCHAPAQQYAKRSADLSTRAWRQPRGAGRQIRQEHLASCWVEQRMARR